VRLAACAALAFAVGCSGADSTALGELVESSPTADARDEPALIAFEEYRDRAEIEMDGRRLYRVEWDLYFETEQQLYEYYVAEANYQLELHHGVREKAVAIADANFNVLSYQRGPDVLDVSYCIKASDFSNVAEVEADMAQATSDWERVVNIRFRYDSSKNGSCVNSTSGVDFAVIDQISDSGYACPTFIPPNTFGCSTSSVGTLRIDYSRWPYLLDGLPITNRFPNLTRVGVLRHELGHMLGLRHEHPFDEDGSNPSTLADGDDCGEVGLPCTGCSIQGVILTDYDVGSVMHYPMCQGDANTSLQVTHLDGVGVRVLYGMPVAWNQSLISLL